jgi:small conductance mechanosensitive channel
VPAIYDFLNRCLDDITRTASAWLTGHLITALLTIAIGVIAAKMVRRSLKAFLIRTRIRTDPLLTNFFLRATYLTILILSLITALKSAGLPIETFVGGLGITGILIGFGLRDTLSNLAAGLFLLIYRPFRAGETIDVEGSKGVVEELTIVNMQMTTTDGVRVIMPNSKVWGAKITNYSMADQRRIEILLKVRCRNVAGAIEIIKRVFDGDDRIIKAPEPTISVSSLVDNAAVLTAWAWTKPTDFQQVTGDQYLRILTALDEAGIEIV